MPSRSVVGALLALVATAGCIQVSAPEGEAPSADDGRTTLQLQVVDAADGQALSGAQATLLLAGAGSVRKATDGDGRATFTVAPAAACSVTVEKDGYQTAAASLDCSQDKAFRVPLRAVGSVPSPTASPPGTAAPLPTAAPPGEVLLEGTVLDAASGAPLAGVLVRLDAPLGPSRRTAADGLFAFTLAPGPHVLETKAPCRLPALLPLDLAEDTVLDVRLEADSVVPAPPAGVRATAGPGPGMVTVSWQEAPGASGYLLLRGGEPLHRLGNSRAYGIPDAGAGDRFAVASANSCGHAGAPSAEVSSAPLPGVPGLAAAPRALDVEVHAGEYAAFAPDGTPLPPRAWRTVEGTGNCCENYLAVTELGRILDQGGSTLAFSDDEGRTWSSVLSPLVVQPGEGSVTAAPDGDVVALDWATYNADTAFAYRYSAATDTWHTAPVPKPPFFDRPWIGVIKGPFEAEGLVVPYVTVVQGFSGLLMSLDGLAYVPLTLQAAQDAVDLRHVTALPDRNRDWLGPAGDFGLVPVDNGVGWLDPINNGYGNVEPAGALSGSLVWRDVALPAAPGQVVRIDSEGTLHALDFAYGEDSFGYAWSHDGGTRWASLRQAMPGDVWQAELRVNRALDQAIVAVHLVKTDGDDLFRVYRFRGLDGDPTLSEVLDVGAGDHPFRGNLLGGGDRFDFMTAGILPSGKAVLSFGDAEHNPASIAIEA